MRITLISIYFLFFLLLLASCSKEENDGKDLEKPTISINYTNGFPQACAYLVRGETYTFRAIVTDNNSLASYSLDIHHNFDHHTHDDQGVLCNLEPIKTAVSPFIFMENYIIENGVKDYEIKVNLTVPNDIDTGDYHCAYSVTDKTGWQGRTSIDIKIIE